MNFKISFCKYILALTFIFNLNFCIAQQKNPGGLGADLPASSSNPSLDFVTTPERLNHMKQTSAEIKADLTQIHALLDKQKQILGNMKILLVSGESRKYCLANENSMRKIADLKSREKLLSKDEIDSLQSYIKMSDDFQSEIKKSNVKCN